MIKSPLIVELIAERIVRDLSVILEARFEHVPQDVLLRLQSTWDDELLTDLVRVAARCADLESFETELVRPIPAIPPMKGNWASESNGNHRD